MAHLRAEPVEERLAAELSPDPAVASAARTRPGGAAPPRQVRPCHLPFGGAAVHPTAGRAAEAGVWLRQHLQAMVHHRWLPRPVRRAAWPTCRAHRACCSRSGVPSGEPAHETDRRTPAPRPGPPRRTAIWSPCPRRRLRRSAGHSASPPRLPLPSETCCRRSSFRCVAQRRSWHLPA